MPLITEQKLSNQSYNSVRSCQKWSTTYLVQNPISCWEISMSDYKVDFIANKIILAPMYMEKDTYMPIPTLIQTAGFFPHY